MPDGMRAAAPNKISYDARGLVMYYNMICAARGFAMAPHLIPFARALTDTRIQNQIWAIGPGSGKSTLLSEVYPGFEVGHDPTATILGISSGEALMQGFQRSVMEVVEFSPQYRNLFPRVRPDKAAGWSAERGMFVTGRELGNPDAGYFVCGLDSKALTGKHAKMIICDDLHDNVNSQSIEACDKLWNTWHSTILGRADPRGCRYIVAGRRWNTEDLYKRLGETGEYVILELPAERDVKDLWVDVTVPDGLVCCFTEEGDTNVQRVKSDRPKIRRKRLSDPDD